MRPETLISYCAGIMVVCTILMTFVAVLQWRASQFLRRIASDVPGAHDETAPVEHAARATRPAAPVSGVQRPAREASRVPVQRYDGGASYESAPNAGEWTGPVTTYTPADRTRSPDA